MFYLLIILVWVLILLGIVVPGPAGVVFTLLAIPVAFASLVNEIHRLRRAKAGLRQAMRDS